MFFRDVVGRRCYILAGLPTSTSTNTAITTGAATTRATIVTNTLIYSSSSTSFVRLRTRARFLFSAFPLPSSFTTTATTPFHSSSSSSSRLHTLTTLTPTRAFRIISKKNIFKLASTQQQRDHIGHSHSHSHRPGGHHHHHVNTYLVSKNKTDAGVRITKIGLYVNLMMAVSKGIGGCYFNSQALVADAFHALTDLVSDFMTLGTVAFALQRPTEKFPNGYGKIESLGSLGVSSLLLFGGIAMGYTALIHLYAEFFTGGNLPEFLEHAHGHGHSHSHSHSDLGPNVNAAWLAAGSIVVKEWLYRSTMKIAKERKSSVLASNAIHHRIDSLTSIVALVAIGGAHFLQNASYLDPAGGLIVSLMVIHAGWGNTRAALMELVDVGLDDEIKESVQKASDKALALRQERLSIRAIGGSKSGQNYLVELTVEVPVGTTVRTTRALEEVLRDVVGTEVPGVKRIKVRFVEEGTEVSNEFIFKEEDVSGRVEEHNHKH